MVVAAFARFCSLRQLAGGECVSGASGCWEVIVLPNFVYLLPSLEICPRGSSRQTLPGCPALTYMSQTKARLADNETVSRLAGFFGSIPFTGSRSRHSRDDDGWSDDDAIGKQQSLANLKRYL